MTLPEGPWGMPRRGSRHLLFLAGLVLLGGAPFLANTGPVQSGLFAQADSAFTTATNPAGLTRLDRPEWLGQLILFHSDSEFEKTADAFSGSMVADESGSLGAPLVYYARPLGKRWFFGASFMGLGFGEDVGAAGPAKYLVDQWAIAVVSLRPSIAYRINRRWSIGGTLALNYNYYKFESAVFNPEPALEDGRMEIEADDFGLSGQLSFLFEASDRTRFGATWLSEIEAEFSETPTFSDLGPIREGLLEQGGALTSSVDFKTVIPQMVGLGFFHEFGNGSHVTLDALWMEFSQFGVTELRVAETAVETEEQDFEDVWSFMVGYAHRLSDRWSVKFGGLYTTQFIEDVNRTQTFKMDRIIGIGVGGEMRWRENRTVGLNLNYYDMGDAPIATEIPIIGSFSGQYNTNRALGLDLTLRWRHKQR